MGSERAATPQRTAVIRRLLKWGRENRRSFPWRNEPDPFRILVAEVLLQRSRSSTVAGVYENLFATWPTSSSLADAAPDQLADIIRPLGLVSRASRLVELARAVIALGEVPRTAASLLALPGVGPYVAAATLAAAHGKPAPVVDSVSARVYARVFVGTTPRRGDETEVWFRDLVEWATPRTGAREWNWAVLDLAALVCLPKRPQCDICPLRTACRFSQDSGKASHMTDTV